MHLATFSSGADVRIGLLREGEIVDVILTRTPSRAGFARTPHEYLRPGDLVEMEIGGIGARRNRVAAYSPTAVEVAHG